MSERGGSKLRRLTWLVSILAVAWMATAALRSGGEPTITITPGLPAIGPRTPISLVFEEPVRGLSRLRVELVQGERIERLAEREFTPRPATRFWGDYQPREEIEVEVGGETVAGLTAGEAMIRATAWVAPALLRRPVPVLEELTLPVLLTPPLIQVLSTKHYLAQGGAEMVIYRVGESAVRDGVEAGDWWFPGYPLAGGAAGERVAWFGAPFDLSDSAGVRLVAEDAVGNRATMGFVDRYAPKPFSEDDIQLPDRFLAKVVPEIMAQTPSLEDRGDDLSNYLQINGELRAANAAELTALADGSPSERRWREAFLSLPGGQVMSSFADRRTYFYDGREVDRQDHLGFDLASTRQAPVPAANEGLVVLARYFGIYGNTVVVDHGFGLMSLYGHLSTIEVAEGQSVEHGQIVGKTGETGLAAGDHLHFTMLLHGLAVNPVEWWDAHWLEDRIFRKLAEVGATDGA